jgi:hypothetical protein
MSAKEPTPGPKTEAVIDQAHMVTPAVEETPGTQEKNARQGGSISTKPFDSGETRPQELHGSVNYQKETSDPGGVPQFYAYTDLTKPRGTVKG